MISISIVRITGINAICLRQMILNSSKFKVCVIAVRDRPERMSPTKGGEGICQKVALLHKPI